MQAADGGAARRVGLIILHKARGYTGPRERSFVVRLDEIAPAVRETARFQQEKPGEPQIPRFHRGYERDGASFRQAGNAGEESSPRRSKIDQLCNSLRGHPV